MNFLRKHFKLISWISLTLVVIITGLSAYELRKIKFNYDFESFFPVNDPDLDVYLNFRKTFEYDNEFVLIGIENKKGIFQKDFLEKIETLSDSLQNVPDITAVTSPTTLQNVVLTEFAPVQLPYLHVDDPSRYAADSALIYRSPELVGTFFSADGKSVSLFLKTTEGINKANSDSLVDNINALLAGLKFDNVHTASKAKGQKTYLERLSKEFFVFFICSFLLVVLFLYISFRSFWGVWVPILVVLLAILWTLALMTAMGKSLDIMTVLLPTMMFVVGMSDVVHIVTKYLEELREGNTNRFDALLKTIKDVGFATFITLLTTSLGFLSLLNSHIIPIRDFGLYTSIGVFIGFVLAFTIVPLVLNVLPLPGLKLERDSSQFWNKKLLRLLSWIFRNSKAIGIGTIIITLLSFWGIKSINLNNYMIEGLTTRDELRQSFNFFEKNFSGVRPFEMIVTPADTASTVLGVKELRAIDKMETWLKKNYDVGFILSPLTLIKGINKAENNGNPEYFILPKDSDEIIAAKEELLHFRKKKELKTVLTKDFKQGRITGKMHDVGSKVIRERNAALYTFAATDPEMKAIHIQLTGAAVMLDKNNEYLVTNTLQGLLLSIIIVGFIIALIHKSWKMALIAVIPNLLPIVIIGGLMGLVGIELKSSTSIIFAIAFGIATDDTVHFLGRLKLELKKGKSVAYALKRTYLSTGKAVIVTSLILSAGFTTLIASGFESTFLFGLLVSITLLIAVVTDLLLFPLLVVWLIKNKKFSLDK
jgi:predicted RND superfamily exporter protein